MNQGPKKPRTKKQTATAFVEVLEKHLTSMELAAEADQPASELSESPSQPARGMLKVFLPVGGLVCFCVCVCACVFFLIPPPTHKKLGVPGWFMGVIPSSPAYRTSKNANGFRVWCPFAPLQSQHKRGTLDKHPNRRGQLF